MSVSTTVFSDEYYERLVADHGYAFVDGVHPLDFPFPGLSTTMLRTRWLCHFRAETFAHLAIEGHRCIVTSGVGLSGPPHAGTVCQILRMAALRRAGFTVQFVLGDLDAYNARARSLEEVHALADQYRLFLQGLGFEGENVTVRTQEQHLHILRTAYLIARHVSDEAMAATEEDLSGLYKAKGVYQGVTFPVKQAILLMIAGLCLALQRLRWCSRDARCG
jgi:tryptophanyl-tRNA synthetase